MTQANKKEQRGNGRRKRSRLTEDPYWKIKLDYKNAELLKQYLNENGKILPRRITGHSARIQRQLTQSIKRARILALLPISGSIR